MARAHSYSPARRCALSFALLSSDSCSSSPLVSLQLVFEYCETWGSNKGMRSFLSKGDVVKVAERYPGVEVVVRRVENRHPHLRGVYSTFKSSRS